jgi:hypothetical protein
MQYNLTDLFQMYQTCFYRLGAAMKIKVVLSLIIVIILLSACANIEISYSLTDDDSLNINYSVSLSSDKDISANMSSIKAYWTEMGFSVNDSKNNVAFILNGDKTVDCDSRGSAVRELSSLFTDKDSLFYNVRFIYTPSYREDIYDLSASISLKDIVRKSGDVNIPFAEIESFLKDAENGKYTLSITLPGEVQETNADERNGQTCIWLLKYGETRNLKLSSKHVFEDKVSHYTSLTETQSRDNLFFMIGCFSAGFLILLIIIIAVVRRAKSNKPARSEFYTERF